MEEKKKNNSKGKRGKSKKFNPYKRADFLEYARFIAFPTVLQDREFGFHTDDGFCKAHKLSRDTVWEWKQHEELWEERDKWMRIWGKRGTPDVLRGLERKAKKDGTASEVKLYLQVHEDFKERTETDIPQLREGLKKIQDNTQAILEGAKKKTVKAKT